jgi:hypothetical protein
VPEQILVLYENSPRGAAAMEQAAEAAARANASLTVVVVAVTEREDAGCCDTRAGYWNGVVRELASADLQRARSLLGDGTAAEFKVVAGRSVLAALALRLNATERTWSSFPPAEAFIRGSDHVGRDGCSAAQPVRWS